MASGLNEIMVITTPQDHATFVQVLGDGKNFGIQLQYGVQASPDGLAQAFIIGEEFINGDSCALILGDNIFHGPTLDRMISVPNAQAGATIFAYRVADPSAYGVVEFNEEGRALSIEEKPREPKSNFAVPGLYFYDNDVVAVAKEISPSARGELEITAVNNVYLEAGKLSVKILPEGTAWLDSGTFESLHDAASYVRVIEERQGTKVGCPEEIAWRNGWISDDQLGQLAGPLEKSGYGSYLLKLLSSKP